MLLSECGGFLEIPKDLSAEKRDRLYQHYGSFDTAEQLLAMYAELMEAIAEVPAFAGFCYTQLTDVEQEMNGLLSYDRRPKLDPAKLAELQRRLFFGGK